jgi:F-type H+-transporting ATPase subunit delta
MPESGDQSIAQIYAEALYDAVVDASALTQVEEEMRTLRAISDPKVRLFLKSPTVSFEDKRKVLCEGLKGAHPLSRNFILLLVQRGRGMFYDDILEAFHEHCNNMAGVAEVGVASARPLRPGEREKLKGILEKKLALKVILKEKANPALLGGFLLAHGNFRWNATMAKRLEVLVERMMEPKMGQEMIQAP